MSRASACSPATLTVVDDSLTRASPKSAYKLACDAAMVCLHLVDVVVVIQNCLSASSCPSFKMRLALVHLKMITSYVFCFRSTRMMTISATAMIRH